MTQDTNELDALLADAKALMEDPSPTPEPEAPAPAASAVPAKKSFGRRLLKVVGRCMLVLLETVLLLVVALYGVMYVLAKGPSPTARDLFVHSVRETSAIGFLANLYFSEEEVQQILQADKIPDYVQTDTSLIQIPQEAPQTQQAGPVADAWGLVDEDGDGIIIDRINGEGYAGFMMIVLDPSRVIMGSEPEHYGRWGHTVEDMVKRFDAVGGINAGGFHDPNGSGNGSIPETMVVYEGKIYYEKLGIREGFVGLDADHILHVGNFTPEDIQAKNIQYGCSFGPILIANGQICSGLNSGINPRTGIGQRSDGAILMMVIDGRQAASLGATYSDMAEVFQAYGAVNAYNLDGGSSTMMWFEEDYLNSCASVKGIRPVPTTFLVLKEGGNENG